MAEDTVPPLLPVSGDVREELFEGSDRLPSLLQLGQDLIPLTLSVLFIHLSSILQPPLELLDDGLLAADLELDGLDMLLDSGITKQQDIPAALAGVAVVVLVELVGVLIWVEDDVSGCDEVLAGVARVGDKESTSSLVYGVTSAQMGRLRAVEKGFRARAVTLVVGAGLYILEPAERMTSDSRISTWTSSIA